MESLTIPLILCSIILTEGSYGSQCFNKSTDIDSCQAVSIKCPLGSVIYSPVVEASSVPCNSKQRGCVGTPVELAVDINQCYWKQSCTIGFPLTYIFTKKCVQEVRSLHVHSWRCVKEKGKNNFVESMCNGNNIIGDAANYGMILSHERIPWNYDKTDFVIKSSPTAECTKTLDFALHRRERIMLTMERFDIDLDNDQLFLNNNLKINNATVISKGKVSIKFTSNVTLSKGGSGFVICYKKINRKDKSKSACDTIMEKHTSTAILLDSTSEWCKNMEHSSQKCIVKEGPLTSPSQKCKLSPRQIEKRCKSCKTGISKCNKKYRTSCPDCCPGEDILASCKTRKNRKSKGRQKGKRQKSKKRTKTSKKSKHLKNM